MSTISHAVNPLFMGCHLDLGFAQEPESIHSQMIYAGSFETVPYLSNGSWPNRIAQADGAVSLDCSTAFNGKCSMRIDHKSGSGRLGAANRGLGNTGLYLQASKNYEGYMFVLSPSPNTLEVAFESLPGGSILNSQTIELQASTKWQRKAMQHIRAW